MASASSSIRSVACSCASTARRARSITTSAARATKASTPAPSASTSSSAPAPLSISSAKPGTVLTGLSILKDRADPIAGPDESYPAWLWGLTDATASADAAGSSAGAGGALASRGDARVAAKRNAKLARQEAAAKVRAEEREAARLARIAARAEARGKTMTTSPRKGTEGQLGTQRANISEDERLALRDAKWATQQGDKRRELRKKNKDAIKASNFVKAS